MKITSIQSVLKMKHSTLKTLFLILLLILIQLICYARLMFCVDTIVNPILMHQKSERPINHFTIYRSFSEMCITGQGLRTPSILYAVHDYYSSLPQLTSNTVACYWR